MWIQNSAPLCRPCLYKSGVNGEIKPNCQPIIFSFYPLGKNSLMLIIYVAHVDLGQLVMLMVTLPRAGGMMVKVKIIGNWL